MFVQPKKISEQSFVDIGMKVADVGCGVGHHTLELAEAIGPLGRVYAIDVQEGLLLSLKKEADKKKLNNIIILLADAEKNTGLEGGSLDRIFFSNSFFQFDDKDYRRAPEPRKIVVVVSEHNACYIVETAKEQDLKSKGFKIFDCTERP